MPVTASHVCVYHQRGSIGDPGESPKVDDLGLAQRAFPFDTPPIETLALPSIGRQLKERAIPNKIFVGNLSFQTSSDRLREILPQPESVVSVAVITDRETQRSRGFAFVEYATAEASEAAIRALQNVTLDGRQLRVNAAEDRPRSSPGGGRPRPEGSFSGRFETPFAPPFSKPKGSRRGIRGRKRSLGG